MEMNSVQSWFLLYGEEVPPKDRAWELFPAAYDAKKEQILAGMDDHAKVMELSEFTVASFEVLDSGDCPYDDDHEVNIRITDDGIRLAHGIKLAMLVSEFDKMIGAGGKFADNFIKTFKEKT
jgi:hypothetical protein